MTQYADTDDLAARVPASLLTGVDAGKQNTALASASETADGYLSARYPLPLLSWTDALRRVVCDIAAYDLAGSKAHGVDGRTTLVRVRYEDALAWLRGVRDGEINPPGIVPSGTTNALVGPGPVLSDCPRGW